MTVSTTTNRWSYTGDGVSTGFTYNNKIFATSDLKVYLNGTLQTLTTQYSVSGAGDASGGTVTFVAAPAAAATVVIVREVPATQSANLVDGDSFPAATVNNALDRLCILIQQALSKVGRALRQPDGDTADVAVLPVKATRASQYLGFDSNGDPVALAAPAGTTTLSSFGASLGVAADATAAKALLGAADDDATPHVLVNPCMQVQQGVALLQSGANALGYTLGTSAATPRFGLVDGWGAYASGGAITAGSLTSSATVPTGLNADPSTCLHLSGWTLTGAGKAAIVARIEAKEAVKFKLLPMIFGINLWHDIGSSKNLTITVSKANAADNWAAKTQIAQSGTIAIADQTVTLGSFAVANMGDCSNGIEVLFELDTGAITTKNIKAGNGGAFRGNTWPTHFPLPAFDLQLRRCMRWLWKTFPLATAPAQNAGTAGAIGVVTFDTGTSPVSVGRYPAPMRISPAMTFFNPSAANANVRDITAGADVGAVTATALCSAEGWFLSWGASGAAGRQQAVHATAYAGLL